MTRRSLLWELRTGTGHCWVLMSGPNDDPPQFSMRIMQQGGSLLVPCACSERWPAPVLRSNSATGRLIGGFLCMAWQRHPAGKASQRQNYLSFCREKAFTVILEQSSWCITWLKQLRYGTPISYCTPLNQSPSKSLRFNLLKSGENLRNRKNS